MALVVIVHECSGLLFSLARHPALRGAHFLEPHLD